MDQDNYNVSNKSLVAKVKALDGYGILSVTDYFDDFKREGNEIDVVSLELPTSLVERVQRVRQRKNPKFRFEEFGHMSLLFNYFTKLDLPLFVGDIYEFEESKIDEIKEFMERNDYSFVYQMCSFQYQERLEFMYKDHEFNVII
ncbi:hypothetical protein CMI45_03350 [Candidatus Pacearchaeota archaeon]|jgi:hypothetical protein|nr:hypothetical protein [Candidatus Pacearchaeota archaeon]|tara:strand:- start:459 stop:890 length:432 start_codon:yes stop_codon:yes gene_type:complete